MNIVGEKIVLRAIEEKDRDMFLELINDSETEKMIGGKSLPVSSFEQEQWIKNQINDNSNIRFVITKKGDDEGIGTIILSDVDYINGTAQVHIKLTKQNGRGQGYGTDALKAIVSYAFYELRLNCIYSEVLSYNSISQKLFEKCNFKRDGVLRSRIFKNNEYLDVIAYSLLKNGI